MTEQEKKHTFTDDEQEPDTLLLIKETINNPAWLDNLSDEQFAELCRYIDNFHEYKSWR